MAKSIGKIFEEDFKNSIPQDFYVERYKDDTMEYLTQRILGSIKNLTSSF